MNSIDISLKTDNELVKSIADNGDNDSFEELSRRHSKLCFSIYSKYQSSIVKSNRNFDDILRDKDFVMWQACLTYKPEKNIKFITWLGNNITWQCLNAISKPRKNEVSIEDEQVKHYLEHETGVCDLNDHDKEYFNTVLNSFSDKRIAQIYTMRYFNDEFMSWQEIGKKMDLSTQAVINLHDKAKDLLQTKLTSDTILDIV